VFETVFRLAKAAENHERGVDQIDSHQEGKDITNFEGG
jgi:hypothetical protein